MYETYTEKDSNVQNKRSETIEKYKKESRSTQSKKDQNALIQSKVFQQAKNELGDTNEDVDIEIERRDNRIDIFEKK